MQSRRDFIKFASVAALAAAYPSAAWAAGLGQKTSLGFSLYGMKTLPVAQALAECVRIGYQNVELALMPGFATDPARLSVSDRKALLAQLSKLNLKVSSLLVNLTLVGDDKAHAASLETIKFAGDLAHEIDHRNQPVIQTVMGGKPDKWEQIKDSMALRLRDWGTTAASTHSTIAVKGHVAMAVNTPDRLLWLLKQAPSPAIVVAYDHSHFELSGITMEESWRQLAPYSRFVHVKEAALENGAVKFLLPGEGKTDYVKYFNLLQGAGYVGPVVVEVSSQLFSQSSYDPIRAAEKSYAALAGPLAASSGYSGAASRA